MPEESKNPQGPTHESAWRLTQIEGFAEPIDEDVNLEDFQLRCVQHPETGELSGAGSNILWMAILIIVIGSLAAIMKTIGN